MSRVNDAALAAQDNARKDTYTGMIQNTVAKIPDDYTAQQKQQITSAEMGGIDVGFGNLKDEMMRRASATGSYAGIPESLTEAGNQSIRQKADAGAQLQEQFANHPTQQALAQASVFQPALSGMLYDRYPNQQPSALTSIIGSALGAAGVAACYIAAAVFNESFVDGPRVVLVRRWLFNEYVKQGTLARMILRAYIRYGERAAKIIKRSENLTSLFLLIFTRILKKAEDFYGVAQ